MGDKTQDREELEQLETRLAALPDRDRTDVILLFSSLLDIVEERIAAEGAVWSAVGAA
jgi:hypothetical protein